MTEWISVKDKLPETDDEDVLVYNPKDGINIGHFCKEEVSGFYEENGSYCLTNCGWNVGYYWAPNMSTTHWMPLPEEPKDIGNNK